MEKEKYCKACPSAEGEIDIDTLKAAIEGAQNYMQKCNVADAVVKSCYECGRNKLQEAVDKMFLPVLR